MSVLQLVCKYKITSKNMFPQEKKTQELTKLIH